MPTLTKSKPQKKCKLTTVIIIGVVFSALATLTVLWAAVAVAHLPKEEKHESNQAPPIKTVRKVESKAAEPAKMERKAESKPMEAAKPDSKAQSKAAEAAATDGRVEYHIVFSTGCSLFQDWQSYTFFYHAKVVNQPGTITRIVSGCSEEDEATLTRIFHEQIAPMAPDRFRIHFTPDYSGLKPGTKYKYWNKPYGMRHWLQNSLGYPDHPINDDAIVVLMDPDQIIMRPFRNNDFSNTEWKFLEPDQTPRTRIEHGNPMGQLYGFGMQWKDKINMTLVTDELPSPVDQMSRKEAQAGYIVGPPYIATARDMYKIVVKWCDFAVPVHDQYPYLLAEMFAYCLAAAHVKLAHQTAASFMISATDAGKAEGWAYIDKMTPENVCQPHKEEELPNVLHFCQRYGIGEYFFGKYRFPETFLTCDSPLLQEPPVDVALHYDHIKFPDGTVKELSKTQKIRNAFSVCQMIAAMNGAASHFKKYNCNGTANYEKTLLVGRS